MKVLIVTNMFPDKHNLQKGIFVKEQIEYLSKNEEEYIKNEYKIRDKQGKRDLPYSTPEEKKDRYLRLPMKNRDIEKLIDPFSYGWEERYYKYLFKLDIDNNWKKKICVNYLEGLEWTLKYYTSGCVDWNWSYNYNYPPLLKDLLKYCPSWKMQMVEEKEIEGIAIFEADVFYDDRGYFTEFYNEKKIKPNWKGKFSFKQDNISCSKKDVLRNMKLKDLKKNLMKQIPFQRDMQLKKLAQKL